MFPILYRQMEIVHVYALHSHSVAAAGRHLIVASAERQSITHFQHVLLTPRFVSIMLCSGFYLRNYLELSRTIDRGMVSGCTGKGSLAGILGVFTCIQGSRIGECGVGRHWRLVI